MCYDSVGVINKEKGVIRMETAVSIIIGIILVILVILLGLVLYLLPTIIAYKREHVNKGIILLINFLLGWTFLGWVGCLVWAFIDTDGSKVSNLTRNIGGNKYEDLARLQKLKENGTITEAEFENEKLRLLR